MKKLNPGKHMAEVYMYNLPKIKALATENTSTA